MVCVWCGTDLRFEDEKTLKDRAWDDWKDENRPNGNTIKNSSGVSCYADFGECSLPSSGMA